MWSVVACVRVEVILRMRGFEGVSRPCESRVVGVLVEEDEPETQVLVSLQVRTRWGTLLDATLKLPRRRAAEVAGVVVVEEPA